MGGTGAGPGAAGRRAQRATSHFPNFVGGTLEAEALVATSPAEASVAFERAAAAFAGVSARSWLRVRWAAVDAAARAGDRDRAVRLLRELEPDAARFGLAWLDRRIDATRRGLRVRRSTGVAAVALPRTADAVMERVARGQPTAAIARSLLVSPATVESHIRAAMRRTGARTRVQAARERHRGQPGLGGGHRGRARPERPEPADPTRCAGGPDGCTNLQAALPDHPGGWAPGT